MLFNFSVQRTQQKKSVMYQMSNSPYALYELAPQKTRIVLILRSPWFNVYQKTCIS